ncbi:hypothetical protein CCAN11_1930015 [Capnocytophaga canimorsus]|uniref:Uncharacterized protein n=1 Tax=Capnocytophaga canimorsus TaxID=28188 RepID=A0A0B7ICC0_9FLAO|nr:hypothetical protein CCAN11_1930015 [Capnocytophaga canimorsus]
MAPPLNPKCTCACKFSTAMTAKANRKVKTIFFTFIIYLFLICYLWNNNYYAIFGMDKNKEYKRLKNTSKFSILVGIFNDLTKEFKTIFRL